PTPTPTPPPRPTPVVATPTPSAPTVSTYGFIWPAAGKITSWFGPSHPLGIDIGMPTGSPVWAAAAGQVTFVGGHPCCSYGYYVIIRHDQTFTTRYGHFSRFAVKLGQHVEQGDLIGYSGSTGASTGPHLHFEIRRNGTPQNPINFLP
ncbi:MAG: M23 family metallopeptidase, partial [Chloroflexi bacterium]|nr:M23 family metallopeptidase [Chloroflexota bacterium]